jgi:predicted amidohydrolase
MTLHAASAQPVLRVAALFITVLGAILISLTAGLSAAEPAQAERPAAQRITLAQIRVGRNLDENLARIRAAFAQAKKDKAEWIMFPEGALSGYNKNFDQAKVAAALTEVMSLCRDARVIAVLGTCWQENGQFTNEIQIIDADGKLVGRYAKHCLTYSEAKNYKVGDTPLVHQVNGLKIGTLICNDLWVTPGWTDGPNPHLTLQQAKAGAQVIFHAVNSGSDLRYRDYHESNLKVRSAEAKCPIVVVNAAGDKPINCASGVVADFEYVKALPTQGEVIETVTFQPVVR